MENYKKILNVDNTLFKGELKNGEKYYIKLLNDNNINKAFNLHSKMCEKLKNTKYSKFLLPKTKENIEKLINGSKGQTIGIFLKESNELIGKSSLYFKQTNHKLNKSLNINLDEYYGAELGGTIINFKYKGNKLKEKLLNELFKLALKKNMSYITSEVCIDNSASLKPLLNQGFFIGNVTIDPDDGAKLYYLFKSLTPKLQINKDYTLGMYNSESLEIMQEVINKGFIAKKMTYDKETKISYFYLSNIKWVDKINKTKNGVDNDKKL